jgi:hypothetical protein
VIEADAVDCQLNWIEKICEAHFRVCLCRHFQRPLAMI